MKRWLWGSVVLLLPVVSALSYSNVIVFGDSLSDIGNMPESPALTEPAMNNTMALNLYVPIANPYMPYKKTYRVPGSARSYTYPQTTDLPQPPMLVKGKLYSRQFKSLTWPQFFVHEAYLNKQLPIDGIQPWVVWYSKPANNSVSIDYAFSGAVTDNLCRNFEYQKPNPSCTQQSIYAGQASYRKDGFDRKLKNNVNSVQIPGVLRQVRMFHQDHLKYKNLGGRDTLYIIYIGGNDMNLSLLELSQKKFRAALDRVLFQTTENVSKAVNRLITQDGAHHIVVMNLLDMGQSPYIQHNILKLPGMTKKRHKLIKGASHFFINMYNRKLKNVAYRSYYKDDVRHHDQLDIGYFDTYNTIKKMATLPGFSSEQTRTYMCLKHDMPAKYYVSRQLCHTPNGTFLFWNGVHPTNYTDEYVADQLLQFLHVPVVKHAT